MWKDIPGYEGYYRVSSEGEIYSCPSWKRGVSKRGKEYQKYYKGKILTPRIKHSGYRYVTLCKKGKYNNHHVHRLVLRAFAGEPPSKKYVSCHNDGDTSNNRLENLRWDTVKNNHRDKLKHGTHNRGDKSTTRVLCQKDVDKIRELYGQGYNQHELAALYGVSQSNISCVVRYITWKYA